MASGGSPGICVYTFQSGVWTGVGHCNPPFVCPSMLMTGSTGASLIRMDDATFRRFLKDLVERGQVDSIQIEGQVSADDITWVDSSGVEHLGIDFPPGIAQVNVPCVKPT